MRASTIGTNSINSDSPVYTIFLGCGIKRDRKREREREWSPVVHLTSVCICSNSLAADYRAASPRRSHVVVLPHFHPYSPISSAPYLRPNPFPRAHLPLDSVDTEQCHVTALEMYRKRRCTDNVMTRLY